LKVIEFRATAEGSSRGGTSEAIKASCAGVENAETTPTARTRQMTSGGVARSRAVTSARRPARRAETGWVKSRSRRRSKRSATLPVHGASSSIGAKFAKVTTPSRSSEPVSR
jgi:hypothetical protein